jgi:hypothetical protein
MGGVVIEFHLDGRSGVAPYMQLIHQVRHALRLGLLHEGDQLPKVKDVAAGLASGRSSRGRWTAARWPRTGRCAATCSGGWARRAAPGWTTSPSRPCSPALFGPQVRRT